MNYFIIINPNSGIKKSIHLFNSIVVPELKKRNHTFDSHITALKTNTLYPGTDSQPFRECLAGYTVLEVKFERSMPPWFHRIIQNYNLRRLSISKFVIGMEQCGMGEDI